MSCQFSPGTRGHRPSKTDASIFRIVVTSHDCHFAELWLSNITNPVGRGQNNSLISFLTTLWFFNSLPMNEPIKQTIIEWGALIVLPQDSEHKRFKVLTQLMRGPDAVPFLRARSTVNPKHLREGGVSLDRQSQARCYKHSFSLCIYLYTWKDIFIVSLPCLTQHDFLHLWAEIEVVQAFGTRAHTHDEAFPWQQKCHKSYLKNSLGLCNK